VRRACRLERVVGGIIVSEYSLELVGSVGEQRLCCPLALNRTP